MWVLLNKLNVMLGGGENSVWNGFEVSKCVCVNERNVCLLLTDLCECVCV